ncbi:HAD family hydrolase [Sphaerisporangium sp. TRM90804]|uniref:HAD family hydrolase n=1 Tax=Sphaerisporangium sp. TRM90804 TaxID=3031113 RepID=UPI00244990C6|nr:HAD family hydrolase [Sphaerisporangium sp. TRM90804]MDH2425627.1 HAD family hydrolase [Sphaerisporangium sp. TRM90804]
MTRARAGAVAGRRTWLFDLDGTLVDSCPAHEAAFRQAIAEFAPGALASFRYAAHAGASTAEVAARLVPGDAVAAGRLARRKQRLYHEYAEAGVVVVLPGARRLLERLTQDGRTVYLVTGGSRGSVERVLSACSLGGYFRAVLTSDDIPVSKPDPRFYADACRRWAVDPEDAVAVEDSAHGVASAVGAGLVTLQVHAAEPAAGAIAVQDLDEIVSLFHQEQR